MYLYLKASGEDDVRRAVVKVDTALVAKIETLTAALKTAQDAHADVDSISANAPGVEWGYFTDDDLYDFRSAKIRVYVGEHAGKTFYSRESNIHTCNPGGKTTVTVLPEGVYWQCGRAKTKVLVSVALLKSIVL